MLYRWFIEMYKKCENVKRQNDSENRFGGVYTSEIWNKPRKPAKKSTPILKKHVQKKKIYIKHQNKLSWQLQKHMYQKMFVTHQPTNLQLLRKLKIFQIEINRVYKKMMKMKQQRIKSQAHSVDPKKSR